MDEATQVAAGGTVLEVELDLLDRHACPHGVDRHARLGPEAGRERKHCGAGLRIERPLPRERLGHLDAGTDADQRARGALGEADAATLLPREPRDAEASCRLGAKRTHVASHVRVEQQQVARRSNLLGGRQGLPLTPARQPQDGRAGSLGDGCRRVARAVVGDDHLRVGKLIP